MLGLGEAKYAQRLRQTSLRLSVCLVLVEELGVEDDVAGLVHTMNVTESSGDGEVGADGGESGVDIEDVLGLGVETRVVDAGVIDTVLLATGDTDLHLEPEAHRRHALEVLNADGDVLFLVLLGEVEHV